MMDLMSRGRGGIMHSNRWRGIVVACLVIVFGTVGALGQDAVNVSEGRTWGIGMQIGMPYGGLISVRSWLSPAFGLEGILFFSGGAYDLEGTVTARGLYRVSDTDTTDFYVALGGTLPLEERTMALSVLGGIEFGFRLAPLLAWNIEFGASYALDGDLNMSVGTGLHYYFPKQVEGNVPSS
jgi:hypothetical protein